LEIIYVQKRKTTEIKIRHADETFPVIVSHVSLATNHPKKKNKIKTLLLAMKAILNELEL
jgi:hypothetical protein